MGFAWRGLQRADLGFITALLLLISFLIVYAIVVAATAEGVRQMGRFIPKQASRRRIYEGSFLGACASVAVLTVTRADWFGTLDEWGDPIRTLGIMLYFIVVVPVKLITFGYFPGILGDWAPPVLLIIAAPIGAAIGYSLPPPEEGSSKTVDSGEQPADKQEGGRKT
jgi:hypothetical protein